MLSGIKTLSPVPLILNRFLKKKKKLPNLPKNTENPWFFEFQIAINGPKLIEIDRFVSQKFRLAPKSHQKHFFIPSLKNSWNYHKKSYPPNKKNTRLKGGGGGKIIKCLLTTWSLNMKKQFAAFSAKTNIQGSRKGIRVSHQVLLYLHFVFIISQKFVNWVGRVISHVSFIFSFQKYMAMLSDYAVKRHNTT